MPELPTVSPSPSARPPIASRLPLAAAMILLSLAVVAFHPAIGFALPEAAALDSLYALRPASSQRNSSADPNWETGFFDSRPVLPGGTLVLADIEGPGVIRHIWTTSRSTEKDYSRLLTLRMYWDDETSPSVECPLGDFFAVGHGMDLPVQSAVVSVTSDGLARNAYWPMPFRRRARITLTNEGRELLPIFYHNIDWERVDALPPDTAYFHAHYRQEYPTRPGHRYVVADLTGRGHYVGTVLSVRQWVDGWYGEGDDLFFLDGEPEPRLRGTGTEDYFCNAWGFQPVCAPYYGAPLFEGSRRGNRASVYRWHIPDPIRFETSLRFELEHNGDMTFPTGESAATDRSDDYASVAFWYQTEPHNPWSAIPYGAARVYPSAPPETPFDPRVDPAFAKTWLQARLDGKQAALTVVRLDKPEFAGGPVVIDVPNPTGAGMRIHGEFRSHADLAVRPLVFDNYVAPAKTGEITVVLKCDSPLDIRSLDPVMSEWTCSFLRECGTPTPEADPFDRNAAAVSFPHRILFDAPFACPPVSGPIVVDGEFDDWPGGLPFALRQPAQIREQAQTWTGPEDASCRFGIVRDNGNLYIAIDVVDDDPSLDAIAAGSPLIDTVLLNIEPFYGPSSPTAGSASPPSAPARVDTDVDIALSFNAAVTPETLTYQCANLPAGTRFQWRATPAGYAIETAIPTQWLDAAQGGRWTAFRFNLALVDFDREGLAQIWWRPAWNFQYNAPGTGVFRRE